jgi:predicted RNA-binding protein with PIN domain
MPFLIDGHNLLWAINKCDELFAPTDDVGLCRSVDTYCTRIGEFGEVIFDGTGPWSKQPYSGFRQVRVVFAGADIEADAVIEDTIRRSKNPRKLIIVSNDRRVRRAALKRKAVALASEDFWSKLMHCITRKRPQPEPTGKRHGLNATDTSKWLREFDLEP